MDLSTEITRRLAQRQKLADDLAAIDAELISVITALKPALDLPQSEPINGSTPGMDVHAEKRHRKPASPNAQIVTRDQIEAFLLRRVDKAIDIDELMSKFSMNRPSATTRLWNLSREGRIVKTGPGTYYVPAPPTTNETI